MQEQKIEINAIVELFGHSRMAGKVTEQTIAGASFIRIDVPETTHHPKFTRFLNPSAVYAINPVIEEVMIQMAESISAKPIDDWDIRVMQQKLLALTTNTGETGETEENLPFHAYKRYPERSSNTGRVF